MQDITADLNYYFMNCNNSRPFILACPSHGGEPPLNVLEVYMVDHPEYYKNMIVAYTIGYGVSEEWLVSNPHVMFAQSADDTGVLLSWNTESYGADK